MPKLGVLNKNVAIKIIIGHIIQQIQIDIAYVIIWGLSCGVTNLNTRILAYFPTIKNSKTNAIGTIMGSSFNASKKVLLVTPPKFSATIYTTIHIPLLLP